MPKPATSKSASEGLAQRPPRLRFGLVCRQANIVTEENHRAGMQNATDKAESTRGRWMALAAALLGWMFDGLEMGLFPVVARPALDDLLHNPPPATVSFWLNVATASFLVGAATGGVLFGWLGDRLGRVRAMMLSVLAYAI